MVSPSQQNVSKIIQGLRRSLDLEVTPVFPELSRAGSGAGSPLEDGGSAC